MKKLFPHREELGEEFDTFQASLDLWYFNEEKIKANQLVEEFKRQNDILIEEKFELQKKITELK